MYQQFISICFVSKLISDSFLLLWKAWASVTGRGTTCLEKPYNSLVELWNKLMMARNESFFTLIRESPVIYQKRAKYIWVAVQNSCFLLPLNYWCTNTFEHRRCKGMRKDTNAITGITPLSPKVQSKSAALVKNLCCNQSILWPPHWKIKSKNGR